MSEARKLRNLALDMRFECERVPIAAVSRRPQVCGLEVPAYAIETHDAAVVAWCAYRLEGGALDLYAWACIERAPKVAVTLSSHGMGDDATEADFDAYVSFVTERLDVPGVDLTVEAAEYGQPGDLVGDSEDTSEVHDAIERLWELFCATPEAWPGATLFTLSVDDRNGNTIDVESGTLEGLAEELASIGYDGPWVRVRSPKDDTTAGWVRSGEWKV